MKKILITTAIFLVGAASMMAQGRINFQPTSTTPVRISPNPDGSASVVLGTASTALFGFGPASAQIQLFAGLTSTDLTLVQIGSAANAAFVLNNAGTIASAQGTFAGGNPLPIPGNNGEAIFIQMRATSLNGLYAGASSIIQITPSLSPAAATSPWSATVLPNTWQGITLVPIPEPSSMVLAGLGAASLLMFRRRK